MEDHLASKSFPRMSVFLHDVDDEVVVPSEKVVFQPHTVLDKSMVRISYSQPLRWCFYLKNIFTLFLLYTLLVGCLVAKPNRKMESHVIIVGV